jgi:hypothetical protein
MRAKAFISLFGFIFLWGNSLAQETGLAGHIQMSDGTKLPGVTVAVQGTALQALTDKDGRFLFTNVTPGPVTITASLKGFRTGVKTVFVAAHTTTVVSITIDPAEVSEEVVVTAQLPLLTATETISEVVLTPTQVTSLPSLGEQDIFRAFQLLPGVSGSNEASSGLYVRGGTPDQNLVLYDGFTIYHVEHLFGYFSAFNMKSVEEARLIKGGFEAKYGGRISSVTELTGTMGDEKRWGGSVGAGLLSFDGHVEVPLFGKGSLFIAGRRSFQSPLYEKIMNMFQENTPLAAAPPGRGGPGGGMFASFESQPKSYFYDLNVKADFPLGPKDDVFVSLYNGRDNVDNSRTQDAPEAMTTPNGRQITFKNDISDLVEWGNTGVAAVNWVRRWSESIRTHLVLSYSTYYNNRDRTSDIYINGYDPITEEPLEISRQFGSVEDNDLSDLSASWVNEFQIGKNHKVEFGFQATGHRIRYDYETVDDGTGAPPGGFRDPAQPLVLQGILESDHRGRLYTAFLQDRWTLAGGRITVSPGIRATYFDVTKESYLEPRLSLRAKIASPFSLKAAWGRYNQFVNRVAREDVLQGNREFWALGGTSNVPVSSADHYIAGLSFETGSFLVDVEAYRKNLRGLAEFATRFRTPEEGADYTQFFYSGTGTAQGLETLIQKKFGDYTGWISYTLGRVEYLIPGLSDNPYPASHDSTHEVKIVNSYELKDWTVAATWIYATGKPYTPLGGVEEVVVGDRTFERPIMGDKNSARLPAYHRLDIAGTYRFSFGRSAFVAGVTLFNLYNRKNVWYKEYEIVAGELVENDFHFMGFTVNAFLNIKF